MPSHDAAYVRDPRIRKDGRCARQGCTRLRPIVTAKGKTRRDMIRYAGEFQLERDPFCSSRCARAFHGTTLVGDEDEAVADQRAEAGRRGKAAGPLSNRRIAA